MGARDGATSTYAATVGAFAHPWVPQNLHVLPKAIPQHVVAVPLAYVVVYVAVLRSIPEGVWCCIYTLI